MKSKYIMTSCGAEYDEKIWAPAENFPGIYCIDINNYNVTVPIIFENEKILIRKIIKEKLLKLLMIRMLFLEGL